MTNLYTINIFEVTVEDKIVLKVDFKSSPLFNGSAYGGSLTSSLICGTQFRCGL